MALDNDQWDGGVFKGGTGSADVRSKRCVIFPRGYRGRRLFQDGQQGREDMMVH